MIKLIKILCNIFNKHLILLSFIILTGCERRPILHLHNDNHVNIDLPTIVLDISVYWNYDISYNWKDEWYYGWDNTDSIIFGPIGYMKPEVFNIRRYFLGNSSSNLHNSVLSNIVQGNSFIANYEYGFYDFLIWNDVISVDGAQALYFDEKTTLEYITATTSPTSSGSLSRSSKYANAFNQPEILFSAYRQGISITDNVNDYDYYDEDTHIYYKYLDMELVPVTYIYLTQLILHHNNGKINGVTGNADLSGMARTCNINTGITGQDNITVHYNVRFKNNCNMNGENVDIAGGKVITFGLCNVNPNKITNAAEIKENINHYLGIPVVFNNGMDSTLIFDVSKQIRQRYKGGVITVELDMDTVLIPSRAGGSAFNAVVRDYDDGGTHEFNM